MEGILNWVLTIQLAFGPLVMGSELVRIFSLPEQVIDLSMTEVREINVTDLETGQAVTISVPIEIEANVSIVSVLFDEFARILLTPAARILLAFPPLSQPFDEIAEEYLGLLDLLYGDGDLPVINAK